MGACCCCVASDRKQRWASGCFHFADFSFCHGGHPLCLSVFQEPNQKQRNSNSLRLLLFLPALSWWERTTSLQPSKKPTTMSIRMMTLPRGARVVVAKTTTIQFLRRTKRKQLQSSTKKVRARPWTWRRTHTNTKSQSLLPLPWKR